jgi:hypothetical protein
VLNGFRRWYEQLDTYGGGGRGVIGRFRDKPPDLLKTRFSGFTM